MMDTEVLGLEIKQFLSNGTMKTLVPRIIGQTANAVQIKQRTKGNWNEDSLLAEVERISGKKAVETSVEIIKGFQRHWLSDLVGTG